MSYPDRASTFQCYVCNHSESQTIMSYRCAPNDTLFTNAQVVQCQSCGLLQINKKFSEEAIRQYYESSYDREDMYHFIEDKFPMDNQWSVSRGRALAKLLREKKAYASGQAIKVMDMGCGYGHLLYGFQERIGLPCTIIGVDYDAKALPIFQQRNWEFKLGGMDDYFQPYAQQLDVLITSHVFEHVIHPNDFLDKALSMLKKGGVLLWEVPNLNVHNLSCEKRHSPHICLWDVHSIRKILSAHEATIVFLGTAGRQYTWLDKPQPLSKFIKKIQYTLGAVSDDTTFSLQDIHSIGFSMDTYGHNRRNLRLIAQKE